MHGVVVQVSTSPGGVPNRPVLEGVLETRGFVGDDWNNKKHHGGPLQAVLLIRNELLQQLKAKGYSVFPGALGENITTEGLSYSSLRIGDRLQAGEALVEITKIRTPCFKLDIYGEGIQKELYDLRVKQGDVDSPLWGNSGFYAKVLQPGIVRAQDIITLSPDGVQPNRAAETNQVDTTQSE